MEIPRQENFKPSEAADYLPQKQPSKTNDWINRSLLRFKMEIWFLINKENP